MSGSFWKFGQDYSTESPLLKTLNKAFIKINLNVDDDTHADAEIDKENSGENALPSSEVGFKDYEPNLDVLEDLLDEEELYTELMCSNFKLLVYFKYPVVISRLMDYVVVDNIIANQKRIDEQEQLQLERQQELLQKNNDKSKNSEDKSGSDDDDAKDDDDEEEDLDLNIDFENDVKSRRVHMAAEILSADVWPISAVIMENDELLHKLWAITYIPNQLPIEASTYFMKINERLLDMNTPDMIDYIMSQEDIVDRFLQHIDDPPIIDFFLKVISTDKPDVNNHIIHFLKKQRLIPKLIDRLTPKYDANIQSATADFLKALLAISGNCTDEIATSIGPNELTRQLTSKKMMEKIIKVMLNGGTSLSNCVGIIIELIRKNNSDYDYVQIMFTTIETHQPNDRDPIYLGHMLRLFAQYMPQFYKLLIETTTPILNTSFDRIEPLGFERFKICELIAELLHCSNMGLVNEKKDEEIVLERDLVRARLLSEQFGENLSGSEDELDYSADEPETKLVNKLHHNDNTETVKADAPSSEITEDGLKENLVNHDNANTKQDSITEEQQEEDISMDDDKEVATKLSTLHIENEGMESPTEDDVVLEMNGNDPQVTEITNMTTITRDDEDDDGVDDDGEHDQQFTEPIEDTDEEMEKLRKDGCVGDLLKIALFDSQIITTILEMFFHFSWNNFLHNVVFDIVQQIFNGPLKVGFNKFLIKDLLHNAEITKLIIDGEMECVKQESENKPRLGYMGHLTLIAEEIVKFDAYLEEMNVKFITNSIPESLNNPNWRHYVETTLSDRRETYDIVLGDLPPNIDVNDEEDDEEGDNFEGHVYGTEHIIFTNELEDEAEDNENKEDDAEYIDHSDDDDDDDNEEEEDDDEKADGEEEETNHEVGETQDENVHEVDINDDEEIMQHIINGLPKRGISPQLDNNYNDDDEEEVGIEGDNDIDKDDEYAEFSVRDNANYYEYVDQNGNRTQLYSSLLEDINVENDASDEERFENDKIAKNTKFSSYMSNQLGRAISGNHRTSQISSSSSSEEDLDLDDDEEEDYMSGNDKRRKLSRHASRNSEELFERDLDEFDDSDCDDEEKQEFTFKKFARLPSPTSIELNDEDVFQHQFELDEDDILNDAEVDVGHARNIPNELDSDDEDNYQDPNDDGQSYMRPNSTYTSYYQNSTYYTPGATAVRKFDPNGKKIAFEK